MTVGLFRDPGVSVRCPAWLINFPTRLCPVWVSYGRLDRLEAVPVIDYASLCLGLRLTYDLRFGAVRGESHPPPDVGAAFGESESCTGVRGGGTCGLPYDTEEMLGELSLIMQF